jgi:hypothetical protein
VEYSYFFFKFNGEHTGFGGRIDESTRARAKIRDMEEKALFEKHTLTHNDGRHGQ